MGTKKKLGTKTIGNNKHLGTEKMGTKKKIVTKKIWYEKNLGTKKMGTKKIGHEKKGVRKK